MAVRTRQSNMELLRIIAMAMVVMCHTNYYAIGEPTLGMCTSDPVRAFAQYLVESLAVVCVNCFIFISGWFSIKLTKRGFANLVFQLLFYSTLMYFVAMALGKVQFSVKGFLQHADFLANFWFVRAYVALFLLSPIFNVFIDHAGKRTARTVLLLYAFLNIVFGWGVDYMDTGYGYSFFHLSFIYLVARYIRVYGGKLFSFSKWHDLSVYLLISVGTAVLIMILANVSPVLWRPSNRVFLYYYNSPTVVLASIYLGLFCTKLNFKSRIVNIVGASCFAVFLIHGDPLMAENYVKPLCNELFYNNSIGYFSIVITISIIALFAVATLVDQVRQWLWQMIQKAFF